MFKDIEICGVTTIDVGLKRGESPNPKRYHLFELAIFLK